MIISRIFYVNKPVLTHIHLKIITHDDIMSRHAGTATTVTAAYAQNSLYVMLVNFRLIAVLNVV